MRPGGLLDRNDMYTGLFGAGLDERGTVPTVISGKGYITIGSNI